MWLSTNELIDSSQELVELSQIAAVARFPLSQGVDVSWLSTSAIESTCAETDSEWMPQVLSVSDVLVVSSDIGIAMANVSSQDEAFFKIPPLESWRKCAHSTTLRLTY